jgi:4-amino-4-deoxy-L-arabinose transferase-like glycosyltransferase
VLSAPDQYLVRGTRWRRLAFRSAETLPIAAITLLAACLRFYDIGRRSAWLDEGFSIHFAKLDPARLVSDLVAEDIHPPLYFLTLHFWMLAFGDSEAAVRSLSAVTGCAAVVVVYGVGRLLVDRGVGLLAAALVALSSFHIAYSQETRSYSLLALLTALSFYFFLKMWKEPSRRHQVGYVLVTVALLYTHLYGLFVILAQNAVFIGSIAFRLSARPPLPARGWLRLQAVTVLAFVPWIYAVARQSDRFLNSEGQLVPRPHIRDAVGSLSGYSGSSRVAVAGVAVIFVVAAVRWWHSGGASRLLLGKSVNARSEPSRSRLLVLGAWLVSPIMAPFFVSLLVTPIFLFKYTIPASLAFYLLVALGWRWLGNRAAAALIGGVVLAGFAGGAVDRIRNSKNENWRGAVAVVNLKAHRGDTVLLDAGFTRHIFRYYSTRPSLVRTQVSDGSTRQETGVRRRVRMAAASHRRVWLVYSHSKHSASLVTRQLQRSFSERLHRRFNGVDLYLFILRRRAPAPPIQEGSGIPTPDAGSSIAPSPPPD